MSALTSAVVGGIPRVNLMPKAEIERRERGKLVSRWLLALLAVLVVVVLASAGTFWLQLSATQRLAAEHASTQDLLGDLAALSEVRTTLDTEAELSGFRAEAMARDFEWAPVLTELQSVLPSDAVVTGYTLTPGSAPTDADPEGEIGATGTLTVTSDGAEEIVALVRSLRALPAVLDADGWQVMSGDGGYIYQLSATLDQTIYTGAYLDEEDVE